LAVGKQEEPLLLVPEEEEGSVWALVANPTLREVWEEEQEQVVARGSQGGGK